MYQSLEALARGKNLARLLVNSNLVFVLSFLQAPCKYYTHSLYELLMPDWARFLCRFGFRCRFCFRFGLLLSTNNTNNSSTMYRSLEALARGKNLARLLFDSNLVFVLSFLQAPCKYSCMSYSCPTGHVSFVDSVFVVVFVSVLGCFRAPTIQTTHSQAWHVSLFRGGFRFISFHF